MYIPHGSPVMPARMLVKYIFALVFAHIIIAMLEKFILNVRALKAAK